MAISLDEVKYIAHLARLDLTDEELVHFQKQLGDVLRYIGKLSDLDVGAVVPMAHVLGLVNVKRPDKVRTSLDPSKVLEIAPEKQGNFFKVPKVIE